MKKETAEQAQEHGIQPIDRIGLKTPEEVCAWWESERSMDAEYWSSSEALSPEKAALLLCRVNPMVEADCQAFTSNGNNSRMYQRLLHKFQDAAHSRGQSVSLLQWLAVAKEHKLPYDPWIDEWLEARKAVGAINDVDDSKTAGSSTPRYTPKQRLQEVKILEILRQKYGDPKRLPVTPRGKPGPKNAAWSALGADKGVFPSQGVFNKAWERLRADGEIGEAKTD